MSDEHRRAPAGSGAAAASGSFDRVLVAGRALVGGGFGAVELGVRDGVVAAIAPLGAGLEGIVVETLGDDEVLLPGLVDTHVHVDEPGRTEWEGFASATRAAAAGGVTTIVDMPLNSIPPTVSVEALAVKRAAAAGQLAVDVGFWGGLVPGNLDEIGPLVAAGVFGFKCFLLPSGVPEFPPVSAGEMAAAMERIAELDSLLIVHAEDARLIEGAPHPGGPAYADFLASRPRAAEDTAIAAVIEAARRTGARAHVLHLSSADSLGRIAAARAAGVRLSVETCPHYLALCAEDVPAGATAFKCCPPIREEANRDALWQGLVDGVIDLVVSDHSPATPELKFAGDGDFELAWGGIASLQLGLPLVWTEARRRGIGLEQVVRWMSERPAELVGLRTKGRLAVGADADLVVFAPDAGFTVDAAALLHRHPVSPYDGRELSGVVRRTLLAGEPVDRERPRGRMLRREPVPLAGGRLHNETMTQASPLERFNGADREDAIASLRPCLDVARWCEELVDGRPYASVDELVRAAVGAASPFTEAEVAQALGDHPRIGERAAGTGESAALSRGEQAGVDPADAELARALAEGNAAYERRFGRVFLVRAAGRSARDILDALTDRLGNDEVAEAAVVAEQLREIAVLRVEGRFS
ncbi:allantoinase AllB [Agromyces sp. NPDC058064]|uniref:allantoinase AllB n=1 Tax=Agromyces sp. NPDC058064 TaxID=3346322 RepID=UPI0036D7E784